MGSAKLGGNHAFPDRIGDSRARPTVNGRVTKAGAYYSVNVGITCPQCGHYFDIGQIVAELDGAVFHLKPTACWDQWIAQVAADLWQAPTVGIDRQIAGLREIERDLIRDGQKTARSIVMTPRAPREILVADARRLDGYRLAAEIIGGQLAMLEAERGDAAKSADRAALAETGFYD